MAGSAESDSELGRKALHAASPARDISDWIALSQPAGFYSVSADSVDRRDGRWLCVRRALSKRYEAAPALVTHHRRDRDLSFYLYQSHRQVRRNAAFGKTKQSSIYDPVIHQQEEG